MLQLIYRLPGIQGLDAGHKSQIQNREYAGKNYIRLAFGAMQHGPCNSHLIYYNFSIPRPKPTAADIVALNILRLIQKMTGEDLHLDEYSD